MSDTYQYRLTKDQKNKIAQNLIDILQTNVKITDQASRFIGDWILTGPNGKRKAFYDVWDIVLSNYLPTTRPVLFRACDRMTRVDKIASFTGRLECARRFSGSKGCLIICDTKEYLEYEEKFYKPGKYRHTFYPLVSVLIKAKESDGWGFSDRLLNEYIGEDEYIMRTNQVSMHGFRWIRNDS